MMEKQIISKFKELPKLKKTWVMFGLGIILILGLILFIFTLFNPPSITPGVTKSAYIGILASKLITIAIVEVIVFIPNLILGIRSYKKGERSWILWIGFLPTTIISIYIGMNILAIIFL